MTNFDYKEVYARLRNEFKEYITSNRLKSVVLGISGGIDSAILAAIYSEVCKECGVELIGRFISIESNSKGEFTRANNIGKAFCTNYKSVDLSETYKTISHDMVDSTILLDEDERQVKIRLGNFKARMRMMYLYNLAQSCGGMVLDTDNKTEHNLGFWTLHGDVGDYTPLIALWKCDVYDLAHYTLGTITDFFAYKALEMCINATPTDGLGITATDVEQFGCKSYKEVDEILKYATTFSLPHLKQIIIKAKNNNSFTSVDYKLDIMSIKYSFNSVVAIIERHLNSAYKRNNPVHIRLS